MNVTDRVLFLRYALPCAETLVKRGSVRQEEIDDLIRRVSDGKDIPEGAEQVFKVALAMCTLIAKRSSKKDIDSDVVRQYFLWEHDEAIEKRYQEMGDFDPEKCRTYPGRVKEVQSSSAVVRTPRGDKAYRKDLVPDIKKDDLVVVHRDFVVEQIGQETVKKLLKKKEYPEKSLE